MTILTCVHRATKTTMLDPTATAVCCSISFAECRRSSPCGAYAGEKHDPCHLRAGRAHVVEQYVLRLVCKAALDAKLQRRSCMAVDQRQHVQPRQSRGIQHSLPLRLPIPRWHLHVNPHFRLHAHLSRTSSRTCSMLPAVDMWHSACHAASRCKPACHGLPTVITVSTTGWPSAAACPSPLA
jgi:hypothetical protein